MEIWFKMTLQAFHNIQLASMYYVHLLCNIFPCFVCLTLAGSGGGGGGDKNCFKCGEAGHFSRECPKGTLQSKHFVFLLHDIVKPKRTLDEL